MSSLVSYGFCDVHARRDVRASEARNAGHSVRLSADNGRSAVVPALIDPGFEVNLVSEAVVQRLRVGRRPVRIKMTGAVDGPLQPVRSATTLHLESTVGERYAQRFEALMLARLTAYRPPITTVPPQWTHLTSLELADDLGSSARIDVILESDVYAAILQPDIRRAGDDVPIAQLTRLGWILLGALQKADEPRTHCHSLRYVDDTVGFLLQLFWELEELPETPSLTPEEQKCETHFAQTHRRSEDGRYEMWLPLKVDPRIELGDSESVARASLLRLERRLANRPALREAYVRFLDDYERNSHPSEDQRASLASTSERGNTL